MRVDVVDINFNKWNSFSIALSADSNQLKYDVAMNKQSLLNQNYVYTFDVTSAVPELYLGSLATSSGFTSNMKSLYTNIFIYPPYQFKAIDALITNFHLPKSTLIMLVSALASKELIMEAYQNAIDEKYRFFSFGDAMFIK